MSLEAVLNKKTLRSTQVSETVADYSTVTGTVKLTGRGQGVVDINFPVTFIEKPNVSFGYELEQGYQSDLIPACNAVVNDWIMDDMKSSSIRIDGCSLGCVVSAGPGTVSYLHFNFYGKAYRNPVSPSMDPKDII
jgi:hypothetical protein